MTRISSRVALGVAAIVGAACMGEGEGGAASASGGGFLYGYDLEAPDIVQWQVPDRLREVSGLALATDGRLFAHDDERAVVYEIDPRGGAFVKAFAFGDGTLRGDFEGIAWVDGVVYLVDSAGRLLRGREGGDGETVAYEEIRTGLEGECEIEGMTNDVRRNLLLIACKKTRSTQLDGRVAVFAWSLAREQIDPANSFAADEAAIATRLGTKRFNPSAIEITPDGKHLLLLSGRQRALVEVDLAGNLVGGVRLAKARHPQPEGLAVDAGGALLIADEGKKGRGRLAVYEHR